MRQEFDTLWAIGPDAVHTVLQLMSGNFGKPDDTRMLAQTGKPSTQGRGADKIAVVPIHGVLTQGGPPRVLSTWRKP